MSGPLMEDRVAIVTGAASGLGAATARLFAEEGAIVVLADVQDEAGEAVAEEIRAAGGQARYRHVDVRSTADVEGAVAYAESEHGRLDTMIANAGVLGHGSFSPTAELSDDDWAAVIDINLSGTLRSFRAAIPALQRAGGGALCATSSVSGIFATIQRIAYTSTKGGINAMVRALAAELSPDRIRVNAVAPGSMKTNIRTSIGRDYASINRERPATTAKVRMQWDERDQTGDVAKVHLFLCSHLANYVSGETIVVDGGASIWNGT
jgi:NAD(P)-dependent dehydrogenase (short-subunit alcohol dehydrogenase family)